MARRQASGIQLPRFHVNDDGTTTATGSWWVELPLGDEEPHGDWLAAYRIAEQAGRLVVSEIRILPWPRDEREHNWVSKSLEDHPDLTRWVRVDDAGEVLGPAATPPPIPDGGLTARHARAGIRTGAALERARQTLVIVRDQVNSVELHSFSPQALQQPRRPGRRGRGDRFYAEIAAAYVRAIGRGSRAPIRDITEELAAESLHYTEPSVRDLVLTARKRGLLTRSPRGQAGGELTDKARRLLDET